MVIDLFSKRQRAARGDVPDIYVYDQLPQQLRGQILHVALRCIGDGSPYTEGDNTYEMIVNILREERGVFELIAFARNYSRRNELFEYFQKEEDIELALDCVELICRAIEKDFGDPGLREARASGIDHINIRFREHGVGFQYENEHLIRVDSKIIHSEVVKPALSLLSGDKFQGANAEFMHAHEHYRQGKNKACLVECLKSLESTIKIILKSRGIKFGSGDAAQKLIQAAFENDLIPSYLQTQFTALRTTLESGVPTLRNKLGGHGQGEEQKDVPDYLASYALHLTACSILFLVQAEQNSC